MSDATRRQWASRGEKWTYFWMRKFIETAGHTLPPSWDGIPTRFASLAQKGSFVGRWEACGGHFVGSNSPAIRWLRPIAHQFILELHIPVVPELKSQRPTAVCFFTHREGFIKCFHCSLYIFRISELLVLN